MCSITPGLPQPQTSQNVFSIEQSSHGRTLIYERPGEKIIPSFYCFTISQQQTQMNNYRHDTSKFSNGFTRPECAPTLKMLLKLKSTSVKNLNVLKQNQFT